MMRMVSQWRLPLFSRKTFSLALSALLTLAILVTLFLVMPNTSHGQTSGNADWPMFGYDVQHTHFNPNETILNTTNVSNLSVEWTAPTITVFGSSPAVVSGSLYVGSTNGSLYALRASDGAQLWSFPTGSVIYSTPAVVNGIVYFGAVDGTVYALQASNGTKLWSFLTGGSPGTLAFSSSPIVVNGIVYIGSADGTMYALNATTGALIWSYTTQPIPIINAPLIDSSPAVVNGIVYFGADDQNVYALDATTGSLIWSYQTGGGIDSSPAVVNGVVYVGSGDKNLYAFNATTGALLWKQQTGGSVISSPAVVNGVVYVGSDDNSLYAFDASTGTSVWSFATIATIESSPAVTNGVVYIGSSDFTDGSANNKVYALDATTGTFLWSYTFGNITASSPIVVNGTVYIGSDDNGLFAFSLPGVPPTPTPTATNTPTPTSSPTPPSRKTLFVVLQGLSSQFTAIQESQNQHPGFDDANGIIPYLQGHGYSTNADFLEYSYPIDFPAGTSPIVRHEILENVHPYSCTDTFDHSLNQDVRTLDLQIRFYLQQLGHENTDIYLIGHSLGGAIAFGYLALLKTQGWPSLPNGGQLKGVITLDSPLGGIETGHDLQATQVAFDTKCGRLTYPPIKVVNNLGSVYSTSNTDTPLGGTANMMAVIFPDYSTPTGFDNQMLADEAVSHKIDVLTIGNVKDYGYAMSGCQIANKVGKIFPLQDFVSSQFVHDESVPSGVYGRTINLALSINCNTTIFTSEIDHGVVLTNLDVEQGIVNFIKGNDPSPLLLPPQLIA